MTSLLDTDNAGDDYVAHRQKTTDRDIVQNFLRQMESEDAAEAKPTGDVSRETKPEGEGGGVLEKAGRVAKDIGLGVIEAPRQIVGGVSDAVHNVFTAGDSLANWLNENVADLKVEVPLTGVDALDRLIANPAKEIAGKKGEVAPAETTTGGFTREAARFLTGFKFAKGVVGGGFAGIPAGAITDFTAQDPDAKRLADIWKQFGLPENTLTDYLASDPTDTEGEKRFKNALEGAALGSITEGLFLGGRYVRAKWQARRTAQQAGLQQLDDLATVPKVTDRDFLLLGDPNEPLVKVSKAAEPEALASARRAGKLTDAMKATETGVHADVAAKGIVGAASDAGGLPTSLKDYNVPLSADITDDTLLFQGVRAGNVSGEHGRSGWYTLDPKLARTYARKEGIGGEIRVVRVRDLPKGTLATPDGDILTPQEYFKIHGDVGTSLADETFTKTIAVYTSDGKLKTTKEGGKLAAKETIGEPAVMVNFARINTGDDVKQVISDMAEAFAPKIDKARRGKITNEATKELADKLGLTVGDLLQRRQGQPFNAETAVAARELWASSAEKLLDAAKAAAAPNAGAVDQFNFRKMMAVHYAVQAEVIGARTETARALQSWRIPAGGGAEKAQAIQTIIDGMGGPQVTQAMAQRLALLAQVGASDEAIAQFARKGALATTMDAVHEAYTASLLWLPPTHLANIMGNTAAMIGNFVERATAEKIGYAMGRLPGDGVAPGEAAAMYVALTTGIKDALRAGSKRLTGGVSTFGELTGKVDLPTGRYSGGAQQAVSSRAFNLNESGQIGRFVDFTGSAIRLPFSALGAEDEVFKSIGYRMAVAAHAWRTAYGEGLTGGELGKRAARIFADPPEAIRLAAVDEALYRTFSDKPGEIAEAVLKARNWDHPLNPMFLIATFVKTPARLFNYSVERSPLALFQAHTMEALKEGGTRADLALAQIATGTAIMLAATDLAMSGRISGPMPKDPAERAAWERLGKTAFSVQLDGKWWPVNRFDPVAMPITWAATFANAIGRGEIDPDDVDEWQEIAGQIVWGISQSVVSKNYMSGVSNFFDMMEGEPATVAAWINKTSGSMAVPSFIAGAERAVDPAIREVNDPLDAIMARIPGLSERLTPSRDLWGQIRMPDTGVEGPLGRAVEVISPSVPRQVKDSPVDAEMVRLNSFVSRIRKKTSFQGVDVNFRDWPEVYDAYVRLAGNELKHPAWGMGAKDFLDAVVEGRHPMSEVYKLQSDGKDGGKSEFIRDTVRSYRELAQRHIMNSPEFADFRDHVKDRGRQRIERSLPGGIKLLQ